MYAPGIPPTDPTQFQRYLYDELQQISAVLTAVALGHLDMTTEAPKKVSNGDLRYAAGTPGWDPGAGKGLYMHNGSAWTLIKAIS